MKTVSLKAQNDTDSNPNWHAPALTICYMIGDGYGLAKKEKNWKPIEFSSNMSSGMMRYRECEHLKKYRKSRFYQEHTRATIWDRVGRCWYLCAICFDLVWQKAKLLKERNADKEVKNEMANLLPPPKKFGKTTSQERSEFLDAETLRKLLGKKTWLGGKVVSGPRETKKGKGFIMDVAVGKSGKGYALFLWNDSVSLSMLTDKFGRNPQKWKGQLVKLSIYEGRNNDYVNVDPA